MGRCLGIDEKGADAAPPLERRAQCLERNGKSLVKGEGSVGATNHVSYR